MKQLNNVLLFLFVLLLPTQLGKHFFFEFSYLSGVRVDYLAPTLYVTDILAVLLITINFKSVWHSLKKKKIIFFIFLLILNLLISLSPTISIYRYIKILEFISIVVIFQKKFLSDRSLLFSFLLGGIFQFVLSTIQFVSKHSLQGILYFFGERPLSLSMPGIAKASITGVEILRPYGTFSHPNSLAGFYILLYILVLTNKKFTAYPFFKFIFLLVSSLIVLLSFSKVALMVFLIVNIIYIWKSSLKKNCAACFVSRIIVLLILSAVFMQAKTDPFSLQKRIFLSQNALEIIKQNPFFGVGLGNYLISQHQFSVTYTDLLNQPVHNVFLILLSEVGVIPLFILLAFFFKRLKIAINKAPYVFIGLFIIGLFDHYVITLQQNFLLVAVLLGSIL